METNKKKLPFGLRLLRVLTILGGILILVEMAGNISAIISQKSGGDSASLYGTLLYLVFNIVYAVVLLVCINKPHHSLYKVLLGIIITDAIAGSTFLLVGYQDFIFNVISIAINLLILWYLLKLKSYFITGAIDKDQPEIKSINKKFVIYFISLFVIFFLIGITIVVSTGMQTFSNVVTFSKEFKDKTGQQAVEYCNSLSLDTKDECLVYLVAVAYIDAQAKVLKNTDSIDANTCQLLNNESKKTSCYAIMNRCDLVMDTKMRAPCDSTAQEIQAEINANNKK